MTSPADMTPMTRAERSGHRPSRGYSWAPFEPANAAALKSGGRSERFISPIEADLLAHLDEVAPWTSAPAFEPARRAWARAEAQVILFSRYSDEHGLGLGEEKPPMAWDPYEKAESRAARGRAELGLTPVALANLIAKMAVHEPAAMQGALDQLLATGAELMRAAEAKQIAAAPEATDE